MKFEVYCELVLYVEIPNHFFTTELTEEERASLYTVPEFIEFLEQSSKIVQRALSDGYDYIRDYTIGADTGP